MSDLGDDREGWASGTTGRRRGERQQSIAYIYTDNVGQNHKIVGLFDAGRSSFTL